MSEDLINKVIIVTGSNGLIGREVIKLLGEEKANVISFDLSENKEVDRDFINCDITNNEAIDQAIATVLEKYGTIDGLVNLAYPRTKDWGNGFEEVSYRSWQQNIDMQLNSVFYICQKVLKVMKVQKSGSIVNIGSIYGVVGNDFNMYEDQKGTSAAYTAIKGGIINFTRYLASYYGKYNLRVNCVSPGGVLDESKQNPGFISNYGSKCPIRRLGNPSEIAAPIVFLLSQQASYITGHNLMVDGGWTAI